MKVFDSVEEWRKVRAALPHKLTLGLVPTMGYLHEGHLSLVRAARQNNDHVAVSIYVNPTQFGPNEDLAQYPRDLDRDLALLEKENTDWVLFPSDADIYPPGFSTFVEPPEPSRLWCGQSRPGHFRGVCTVVSILFNLTRPTRAYFGRKDAQQAAVIRRMTQDLRFPVEIVVCPTVREPDGLALSSRNVYLSPTERQRALVLSQTLFAGVECFQAGERAARTILEAGARQIENTPGVRLDYLGIVDQNTFAPVETVQTGNYFIGAIYVGKTRLIDNRVFESQGE
ncbi:MAG: pantoate--beta-alanine ligase [bacterium]